MRLLTLYLRSRRAPLALGALAAMLVVSWTLWSAASDERDVGWPMVILTVLLLVSAAGMTLSGPDDALDRTAAWSWQHRRAAHLLVAFGVIAGLLALTLLTGARFGPVAFVLRDAAGLLGLTALTAAVLGAARSWTLPLGWTLAAVVYPIDTPLGQILVWQAQAPDSARAGWTAGVLAAAGLIAYTVRGAKLPAPAEASL